MKERTTRLLLIILCGICLFMAGCVQEKTLDEILLDASISQDMSKAESVESSVEDSNKRVESLVEESKAGKEIPCLNGEAEVEIEEEFLTEAEMDSNEEEALEQEESFLMEEATEYAFKCLSAEKQIWYQNMKDIIGSMKKKGRLSKSGLQAGLTEKDIDQIFQCLMVDHPELFYIEGYSYTKFTNGGVLVGLEFQGTYTMTKEEALSRKQQMKQSVDQILSGISSKASEYDKVKYVYETIVRKTEYDLSSSDNQNVYSVFINHASVCQGYAKACQYLLNKLGIECVLALGKVNTGEGHAWNLVKIDGSYYYVDTTWGDASYQRDGETTNTGHIPDINYDYLCVTSADLMKTHTLESCVPMPECVDTRANYYVMEDAYFTSYDKDKIKQYFQKCFDKGLEDITIKCADAGCYDMVVNSLIGKQEIFAFLPASSTSVSYASNEEQCSLTFWVTNR